MVQITAPLLIEKPSTKNESNLKHEQVAWSQGAACHVELAAGDDSGDDSDASQFSCSESDSVDGDVNHSTKETGATEAPERSSSVTKARVITTQWIGKPVAVVALLYIFICSLDLLGSAFKLLGGKAAGEAFSSNVLLQNPVAGLMIGILATVLVQSSSTSTSIVVTMVSSGIMPVGPAIPIIMGANIGTSVTNTIVSLAQSSDRGQFERAFAGATVHDMFNWLAVIVLLPLEVASGYLYHATQAIVDNCDLQTSDSTQKDMLKALTKPLTKQVIQLDKKVIEYIAMGHEDYMNKSLMKEWCSYEKVLVPVDVNSSLVNATGILVNGTLYEEVKTPLGKCSFLFSYLDLNDTYSGLILLAFSIFVLCTCLVLIVKILNSVLKGPLAKTTQRVINKDLPGRCGYFTGYLAMLAGAGMTILVQSSSVFTSTLTPLVGLGVVSLERMYPLTLGSNIGTTSTGLLAAMAAPGDKLKPALQIALVHLFFNISGILLFYPVPVTRLPIKMARIMGSTTAKYRWFAVMYLVVMFFMVPSGLFALSMAGTIVFFSVLSAIVAFFIFILIINLLKKKYHHKVSEKGLAFLNAFPKCFYSLEPVDKIITCITGKFKALFSCMGRTLCPCKSSHDKSDECDNSDCDGATDSFKRCDTNATEMTDLSSRSSNSSFSTGSKEDLRDKELTSQVQSLLSECTVLTMTEHHTFADSAYVTLDNSPNMSKYPSVDNMPVV